MSLLLVNDYHEDMILLIIITFFESYNLVRVSIYAMSFTERKMSVFGVILFCIFIYPDWIWRGTEYLCGKMRTRIILNTDTFYAVTVVDLRFKGIKIPSTYFCIETETLWGCIVILIYHTKFVKLHCYSHCEVALWFSSIRRVVDDLTP